MKSIKSPITLFLLLLGMLSSTTSAFVGPQAKVSRISSALQITKSGGKLIETAEQFTNNVLGKNTPRPVLAFFTAPWYVGERIPFGASCSIWTTVEIDFYFALLFCSYSFFVSPYYYCHYHSIGAARVVFRIQLSKRS
jgi:hypothetical protein